MTLSKRERVIRTLELEEVDKCPIYYMGMEQRAWTYQQYLKSKYYKKYEIKANKIEDIYLQNINQFRFFGNDVITSDPITKTKPLYRHFDYKAYQNGKDIVECMGKNITLREAVKIKPGEYFINALAGRLWLMKTYPKTGVPYNWFIDSIYSTPEIMHEVWNAFGKPIAYISGEGNWNPKIWKNFIDLMEPYMYPWPVFGVMYGVSLHDALMEGVGFGKAAFYMRKKPEFIHEVLSEYAKLNVEIVKRLGEMGVEVVFYGDDLGQKGRSLMSPKNFKEFMLPHYAKFYNEVKKHGMFIAQHADGYVDEILPMLVDIGLNCIQSLDPSAGVNLVHLKETLGDKLAFMGHIDSSRTLNFGTPKEIEEDVKNVIKIAASGGGYFAGPSHQILDAPLENVIALRDAILKYRNYPINI
ncbi:MAG: uroporphyrinogen decarboxylase family protein [Candidatus Thorarchaeota archaeon]